MTPHVFTNGLEQQSVRDVVKQPADVKLDHPGIAPTPLPGDPDRIQGRFAWSVAIGVIQKVRLDVWFNLQLDNHLGHSVRHRRHPEDPFPTRFLRYRDRFHRCGKVTPRGHPIPQTIQIALEVLLEIIKRLMIHTRSSPIGFHQPVRLHHELLGDDKWFCLHPHLLLESPVGYGQDRPTSPLRSIAITPTSSLLRATPSQCLASVLRFLWGRHLNGSLRIETTGSRSSVEKPGPGSRHRHAGHRLGSLQGNPQTHPDGTTLRRFRCHVLVHDESAVVHFRSSSWSTPVESCSMFPQRSRPALLMSAVWGGLKPAPDSRLRRASRHLLYSLLRRTVVEPHRVTENLGNRYPW